MGMTNQEAVETIKANYPPENYSMLREALGIALALLKAQEPRVLTSSELQPDNLVWIEVPQSGEIWPALLRKTDWFGHPTWAMRGYALAAYYLHEGYGRDWRCWSARPTYEQREEAAWDD